MQSLSLDELVADPNAERLNVLMIAPNCDGTDVGEAWRAFKWVKAMAEIANVTLISFQRHGQVPVTDQLPDVEIITFDEPVFSNERLNAMLKPGYPCFFFKVKSWIRKNQAAGRVFDVGHQVTPSALRYPSPFLDTGIPYILGPVGGSMATPRSFRSECRGAPWFVRLRMLDRIRLAGDPFLRRSFKQAAAVIGVAPYVGELLSIADVNEYYLHSELTIDDLAPVNARRSLASGEIKLLHVGRGVRTKGLRDLVRAMAQLKDLSGVTLDSAGGGEEIEICKREAIELGVADRITFHGHVSREEVEALYRKSDVFVFPSFREPSGRVISEALRWGLPVVTTNLGGPGSVINASCGFTLPVEDPEQLATDLASTIRRIAKEPFHLVPKSIGGRRIVAEQGLWRRKANVMLGCYQSVAKQAELA
ncbi:MAG: glycosyltransferase family 4 protein [Pseudomonadales bacterium]|nr:glycosyltransferase family 4 protein [Pseudomonadales bacterium]